jgi:hypothetical protein
MAEMSVFNLAQKRSFPPLCTCHGVSKIRPRIKTNIFPRNNSESLTWSAKSQQKVSIADCQTFSDSIDEKSAKNLNLYYFDAL